MFNIFLELSLFRFGMSLIFFPLSWVRIIDGKPDNTDVYSFGPFILAYTDEHPEFLVFNIGVDTGC